MKKRIMPLILLTAVLLAVFAFGQGVSADDRYYTIDRYIINVDIQPNGSAFIEERLLYNFHGNFNGVLRDVDYSSTDGMEDIRVMIDENGSTRELTLNSTSNLDDNVGSGNYNVVNNGQIAQFKVFESSSSEEKTFVYRYIFRNVVTKYNDIAEFNRKIVDANWDVTLDNVTINIKLPEGALKEDIKVFGHGSLIGLSEIIDERNVKFSIDYVNSGNMVETLVLFPTSLVPNSGRVVAEEALPRIMANESKLAEQANLKREQARREVEEYEKRRAEEEISREASRQRMAVIRSIGNGFSVLLFLGWFALIIYLYIKYDKELRPAFSGEFYRELPGEYTPAEMSYLLSMGSVGTRDITATLMDLVRKGQLLLTTETYTKSGIFKTKTVEDYCLSINPQAPYIPLKRHEAFLISWFIGTIGDGNRIMLDEIADYAKTSSGARHFSSDYDTWRSKAVEEGKKNNFFDKGSSRGKVIGILSSLGFIGLGMLLSRYAGFGFGIVLIILGVIMLIFSARLNRRTAYGNEQNAMWIAFKKFLKEFSNMHKAEIPSIVIWEHYLVYAISLGVAKEVIKQLPLVFTDADLQNTNLTYMYGYRYSNLASFADTFDRTINTVDSAISHARAVANSTNSSSSGGGGGFSGGSSGGGGGGGGGGAF